MPRSPRTRPASRHAALFIDYAHLHARLTERLDAPADRAAACIREAARELRRYLADEDGIDTVQAVAYADFAALEARSGAEQNGLQHTLYEAGIDPRFAPVSPGDDDPAAAMQLSVEATAFAHRRADVETIALMTGVRALRPLVQAIRKTGTHALVAALDPPASPSSGGEPHPRADDFMDVLRLLSDATRREVLPDEAEEPGRDAAEEQPPAEHHERLDDEMLFRTLEVAEEHFGQYDEVYLTPLLRKLSDVLGERFDPKALVSGLEDAGAVRLEKRRGYPYDYTVLIVDRRHPDVQRMEEQFYDDAGRSRYERASAPSTAGGYEEDPGYGGGRASNDGDADYEDADYEDAGYEEYDEGGPDRY
jgi:DNA-binding transcriptional ArsR family regulator